MSNPIDTEILFSNDTKKLIEAHEVVAKRIGVLTEGMAEILEVLAESRELLKEIKEALQGD